ncbi:MAG: hypothetical protein M1834_005543 [Cirrosporium novae-zelandiae]|nr:MAG: hypothetical protein M1834_005543 [Cirrosporium novae-zelandiae]
MLGKAAQYLSPEVAIFIAIVTIALLSFYRIVRLQQHPFPLGAIRLFPPDMVDEKNSAVDTAKASTENDTAEEEKFIDNAYPLSSIFAVHGLGAHSLYTWTTEASQTQYRSRLAAGLPESEAKRINWLKEFIPEEFPAARVLTITTQIGFSGHQLRLSVKQLPTFCARFCERENRTSFGGIVIKEALIQAHDTKEYKDIFDAIYGILFLGTPHQGSSMSWLGQLLAMITAPLLGSNKMLLHSLEYHEYGLTELQQRFSQCLDKTDKQFRAFYETLPTTFFGFSVGLVVDKASALYNLDGIDLNKNHRGLNKFQECTDPDYHKIVSAIRGITIPSVLKYREAHKLEEINKLLNEFKKALMSTLEIGLEKYISQERRPNIHEVKRWFLKTREYQNWFSNQLPASPESRFLWYTGRPNIGKTAIAADVAHDFKNIIHHLKRDGQELLHRLLQAPVQGFSISEVDYWDMLSRLIRANRARGLRIVIEGLHHMQPEEEKIKFVKGLRNMVNAFNLETDMLVKVFVTSLPHNPIVEVFEGLPSINLANEVAECLNSLRPMAYNVRQESVVNAYDNTDNWIQEDPDYAKWKNNNTSSILWISGKARSGKSTLLKKILKAFRDEYHVQGPAEMFDKERHIFPPSIADFEFDRRDKLSSMKKFLVASFFYSLQGDKKEISHRNMLLSILFQLLRQEEALFFKFRDIFLSLQKEHDSHSRRQNDDSFRTHRRDAWHALTEHGNGFQHGTIFIWPLEDLECIFRRLLHFDGFPLTIYLFIDAVDESEDVTDCADRLSFLRTESIRSTSVTLKCLVTSRPEETLSLPNLRDYEINLHMKNEQNIGSIINTEIKRVTRALQEADPGTPYPIDKIKQNLSKRANGVILWVSLILKDIQYQILSGSVTHDSMMNTLENIPNKLENLYIRIINQLNSRKGNAQLPEGKAQSETKQWLQLTAFSGRLFSIEEFRDVVIVTDIQDQFDGKGESLTNKRWPVTISMVQRQLTQKTGGFIEMVELSTVAQILRASSATLDSSTAIQFLHQSVKDFLQKDKAVPFRLNETDGNGLITRVCINYMRCLSGSNMPVSKPVEHWTTQDYDELLGKGTPSESENRRALTLFPQIFRSILGTSNGPALYVTASWLHRVSVNNPSLIDNESLREVLNKFSTTYLDKKHVINKFLDDALVSAARAGLSTALKTLIAAGANKFSVSALDAAVFERHFVIVEYLTTLGLEIMDVDLGCSHQRRDGVPHSGNRLNHASSPGLLASDDSSGNIRQAQRESLLAAPKAGSVPLVTELGHRSIIPLLAKYGADISSRDSEGMTPLHLAARNGNNEALLELLNHGEGIETKNESDQTALELAKRYSQEATVRALLENGATDHILTGNANHTRLWFHFIGIRNSLVAQKFCSA